MQHSESTVLLLVLFYGFIRFSFRLSSPRAPPVAQRSVECLEPMAPKGKANARPARTRIVGKSKAKATPKPPKAAAAKPKRKAQPRAQPPALPAPVATGAAEDAGGVAIVGNRAEVDAFVEHAVFCKCCGEAIAEEHAQKTGRLTQDAQFKCNKCNATITRMQRQKLAVSDLDGIDKADREEFFKHAQGLYGPALWSHHKATLKKITTNYDTAETSGDYLPVNVHVANGWTEDQIKAYNDCKEDPRLGTLWRVPVLKKSSGQTQAESHEQEDCAETASKRIKAGGNTSRGGGKPQLPQDPSQWTEAHDKIWATKMEKELKDATAKLEDELKVPEGGDDVLAPMARAAAQTAITNASAMQDDLGDVANETKSLADVREATPVEDYVKSAADKKKALAHHVLFIKRIKTIAAKQFGT